MLIKKGSSFIIRVPNEFSDNTSIQKEDTKALLMILVVAALADGKMTDLDEKKMINKSLSHRFFKDSNIMDLRDEVWDELHIINGRSEFNLAYRTRLAERCAKTLKNKRSTDEILEMFELACKIIYVDRLIDSEENEFLDNLSSWFDIEMNSAQTIKAKAFEKVITNKQ